MGRKGVRGTRGLPGKAGEPGPPGIPGFPGLEGETGPDAITPVRTNIDQEQNVNNILYAHKLNKKTRRQKQICLFFDASALYSNLLLLLTELREIAQRNE